MAKRAGYNRYGLRFFESLDDSKIAANTEKHEVSSVSIIAADKPIRTRPTDMGFVAIAPEVPTALPYFLLVIKSRNSTEDRYTTVIADSEAFCFVERLDHMFIVKPRTYWPDFGRHWPEYRFKMPPHYSIREAINKEMEAENEHT